MTNKIQTIGDIQRQKARARYQKLLRERERILDLPPEKALDRILSAREPAALVHAFPEEDFYLLVHDVGPEDSLQLLSLASDRQLEFILDVESWEKDRIEFNLLTKWLNLFLNSDPVRFIKWFLRDKTEFIEFYLFKNIEVVIREHDQDPSDIGAEYFSFDDTFYIRFIDYPFEGGLKKGEKKYRDEFLLRFFERLCAYDHTTFQQVLLESTGVIPAESEEEAYRLRNVRLAEKGFLPFEEAVGIYQYFDPRNLEAQVSKKINVPVDESLFYPAPYYAIQMTKEGGLFSGALKAVEGYEILQQIQTEFAGLCNQIIAADRKKIRDRKDLQAVVKKACGYISMGLERLLPVEKKSAGKQLQASAALILQHPLIQIFRTGYGLALKLKWRADKWRRKSWFEKAGLPLSFWGEDWVGVLGGLLIKRPLFYDNYQTGALYREFRSLDDLRLTEHILNEIIAFDDLLSLMNINMKPVGVESALDYKNLVLTMWARTHLSLTPGPIPLSRDEFRKLFDELWIDNSKPRKIQNSVKEAFLSWISNQTGLGFNEINQRLAGVFEGLFGEIESEYGNVQSKYLDPRYIRHFLIDR